MKFDLARAMREAAQLTRARKLPEAVRAIQNAMGMPLREATKPEADDVSAGAPALDLSKIGQRQANWPGMPRARPLAETIKALHLGRLQGLPSAQRQPAAKAPPLADGAQFLKRNFASSHGERAYKVYLPRRAPAGLPLVVMLHGCTQTPDDFAVGTRMNALAEEFGFVVVYPSQSKTANQSLCWNWFQRSNTARESGEAAIIAGITRHLASEYSLDAQRVFVAGMSAGGAMAAIMAAEYPDVYAAVGIHSGLPAGSATDLISAFAAMRGDHAGPSQPQGRRTRTIAFHGSADATVHPSNAERVSEVSSRDGDISETTMNAIRGRSVTRTVTRDRQGVVWLEQWLVGAGGHAWSGGDPAGSFTDSAGPDASREIVRYFLDAPGAAERQG